MEGPPLELVCSSVGSDDSGRGPPITINELVQLAHIGIPIDQVTWSRVTMTSDKWIAVRHDSRSDFSAKRAVVTVLSPIEGTISYAGSTSADSVLMNPVYPRIALKAGLRFEVFNLDTKELVNKVKFHEPVIFWTWLTADVIAMVTDSAVYHWSINEREAATTPEQIFVRHNRLAFTEIVGYKGDPSLRWLALTGLTPEIIFSTKPSTKRDERISGVTQLYNRDEDITQCITAHAVCFSTYHFPGNPYPSTVMCVSSREAQDHGKVHVIELGPYKTGNFAPRNSYDHLHFLDDLERYDFPISLQISVDYGLLFVVTKYGYLYMCDMETAMCLCCTRVAVDVIFAAALNTNSQGILAITRGGQVITVDLKKDGFISFLREQVKTAYRANRFEKVICP
ncbi:clathrin heavy chain-like isoform X1 [Physella acuta]|uniref:clathrin heavy chain-like isoform X1 n=1 Tax=Physella acuta TaxID=109671 RepID=UPI0027DCFD86|nr:clathrin heavy chain-like isoform X1 [Physella acuta]XP_059169270.1 clathrin heavy chain-like isoform X1 [Physella acuta]XP_059169271.1 clathrin heavy chain-like isoform X1 [Physella acuta]XP_059169272.1 clathrin heavy chain-like isoform X1 [Physella acuta]XP_059169273.1 clathrin heavy chain-like isoform X1 [Physella acuta]XP_059169274.1 clathrin heavy chain-like isoform X1 [Physella acuta]XP_059169275.1 clathrin heavy chain-like isoform X1 [Physella acuta]